jgi:16S rRNA (cytosine1402-N4)-methyltransferase
MISGESRSDENPKPVHVPVLLQACIDALQPRAGGTYFDLTLGGGGHARAILEASAPDGILFGLDRDGEILELTRAALKAFEDRIFVKQGNFSDAAEIFADHAGRADGVIMDLGLSSYQLDRRERGFSLRHDGPLDLRMDGTQTFTGKDLVNQGDRDELLHAIGRLGEEPRARAIVKALLEERERRPLLLTSDIRRLVERVYGRKGGRIHPATRVFQGLRMCVNHEIESLSKGLDAAFRLMTSKGRLAVLSFHSGEDRVVKNEFNERAAKGEAKRITKKPIRPDAAEIRINRRSRSACLRILEKR